MLLLLCTLNPSCSEDCCGCQLPCRVPSYFRKGLIVGWVPTAMPSAELLPQRIDCWLWHKIGLFGCPVGFCCFVVWCCCCQDWHRHPNAVCGCLHLSPLIFLLSSSCTLAALSSMLSLEPFPWLVVVWHKNQDDNKRLASRSIPGTTRFARAMFCCLVLALVSSHLPALITSVNLTELKLTS